MSSRYPDQGSLPAAAVNRVYPMWSAETLPDTGDTSPAGVLSGLVSGDNASVQVAYSLYSGHADRKVRDAAGGVGVAADVRMYKYARQGRKVWTA